MNKLGEEVHPKLEHVLVTQEHHLRQLRDYARESGLTLTEDPEPPHQDAVIAESERIARWVEQLKPPTQAWMHAINLALQRVYEEDILKLSPKHSTLNQALAATGSGAQYIEQCQLNGVPSPASVNLTKGQSVRGPNAGKPPLNTWINWGSFDGEFVLENREAELWSMELNGGVCLALPRWVEKGRLLWKRWEAPLAGVICLGYQTGKVCYFDNIDLESGESRPLNTAVSGTGLTAHETVGGVCSDCHAGNNPFIVHPDYAPFRNLVDAQVSIESSIWPEPIVPASWPQNPGPMQNLGPPPSGQLSCNRCHNAKRNLQFPDISTLLPAYCDDVMKTSFDGPPGGFAPTMPQIGTVQEHNGHIERIRDLCETPPMVVTVIDYVPDDDEDVVSPPILGGPLYECSTVAWVRGARIGSTVTLYVGSNNNPVASQVVVDPDEINFEFSPPLEEYQQVWVTQTSEQGVESGPSNTVGVKKHTDVYPDGLPLPEITPNIVHECGYKIAVKHIPGAFFTVTVNSKDPVTSGRGATGYSLGGARNPLVPGDQIRARQMMCEGDEPSPYTSPTPALPAPSVLGSPRLNPPLISKGQEKIVVEGLTYSADISIEETTSGSSHTARSHPLNWEKFFPQSFLQRSVQQGDDFLFSTELCGVPGPTLQVTSIQSCQELPPLRLQQPFEDDDFVVVENAVPGATIRVWSIEDNGEIGDGGGQVIRLTRPLNASEEIIVVQQLDDCPSSTATKVKVK